MISKLKWNKQMASVRSLLQKYSNLFLEYAQKGSLQKKKK